MNPKPGLKLFCGAMALAIGLLIPYEYYWRCAEGWTPGYDDNVEIWAYWRRKVDKLSNEDIVILGSSRGHFDLNIHIFDSLTGHRPIMLATPGGSPFHTLEDIVENTDFKGLMIVSVAPGLFFTVGSSYGAARVKEERIEFARKQTYASRFSQTVYQCIDPHFAFLEPDLSLRQLVHKLPFPDRDSVRHEIIWPPMVHMDRYRSIRMNEGMETDTFLQNWQTRIWDGFGWKNPYADSIDVILNHYASHAKTFRDRGGRIAFIRPPVTGKYLEQEPLLYPREKYWDELLRRAEAKGYEFQDYPETKNLTPPEWSHLNRKEADIYTRFMIQLLKQDGLL